MNISSRFKKPSYQKRIKLRHLFFFFGTRLAIISAFLFIGGLLLLLIRVPIDGGPLLLGLGLAGTIFGSIFSIIFGRVGWSRNIWVDLVLNKSSVFLAFLGFGCWIYSEIIQSDDVLIIGLLFITVGVILAVLGMKFNSSIDEIDQSSIVK